MPRPGVACWHIRILLGRAIERRRMLQLDADVKRNFHALARSDRIVTPTVTFLSRASYLTRRGCRSCLCALSRCGGSRAHRIVLGAPILLDAQPVLARRLVDRESTRHPTGDARPLGRARGVLSSGPRDGGAYIPTSEAGVVSRADGSEMVLERHRDAVKRWRWHRILLCEGAEIATRADADRATHRAVGIGA